MSKITTPKSATPLVVRMEKLNGERYEIHFTRETICAAIQTLARWASNPDLSFRWADTALMVQGIRDMTN